MAKTLRVKAGKNGPVFLPEAIQGVQQITDEWIEVPATSYIRGRLRAGDLVQEDELDGDDEDTTVVGQEFTPEGAVTTAIDGAATPQVHTSAQPGVLRRRPTNAPGKGE